MNLLVAGRITGSVLIICADFVILHVSTFYGAIIHVIDKPKPKSKGFK